MCTDQKDLDSDMFCSSDSVLQHIDFEIKHDIIRSVIWLVLHEYRNNCVGDISQSKGHNSDHILFPLTERKVQTGG